MAKVPTFCLIILLSLLEISISTNSQEFYTSTKLSMRRPEQLTHFQLFLHNFLRGDVTSAVVVAQAATTNTYRTKFGEVVVVDDRLTEGPNLSSRVVARVQGMYVYADVRVIGVLAVYNYLFTAGRLNGSTLSVIGRYQPRLGEVEMPVVGGTGRFRSAKGYVRVRNLVDDWERGIGIDEHHVYVTHY